MLDNEEMSLAVRPGALVGFAWLFGMVGLGLARAKVRETTLTATWWWSLAALSMTCGVELLAAGNALGDEATASLWRYTARVLLLCPAVSLVGAKHPQDGPWNFVVLSLWGVLALPAAESLLLHRGQPIEVHGFWSWFLAALVFLALVNVLPTRHALAGLLAVCGQTLLLWEYLPYSLPAWPEELTGGGTACLAAAALMFAAQPRTIGAAKSLDRLWLDFRDTFGLFWGLRVQERLLAAAKMYEWPVTLGWTGWVTREGQPLSEELPEEQHKAILLTLRGLLRRFVSNEWIETRLRGRDGPD